MDNKKYKELENFLMPFGKHKGEKLANIDASYLLWLYNACEDKDLPEEVKLYVEETKEVLLKEIQN